MACDVYHNSWAVCVNAAMQHNLLLNHDPPILHTTFLARMMRVVSVPALEERVAYFAPFVVFWD